MGGLPVPARRGWPGRDPPAGCPDINPLLAELRRRREEITAAFMSDPPTAGEFCLACDMYTTVGAAYCAGCGRLFPGTVTLHIDESTDLSAVSAGMIRSRADVQLLQAEVTRRVLGQLGQG